MNPPSAPWSFNSIEVPRATVWKLPGRELVFSRRPLLMGILNVTPDSFSDGGQFVAKNAAIDHALKLAADGADILDVGGESTRPYSQSVDARTELARVLPVIEALRSRVSIPISIDTSKAIVAREALAAGAAIINDVTALTGDSEMIAVASTSHAAVCAMHMQGRPDNMQNNPAYEDVVTDVLSYLNERRDALVSAGIDSRAIALDPGIGFGKTHQHNLDLLAGCYRFHTLGCPLLVGASRKGMIGKVLRDKEADRTAGTIGVAISLARQGVQVLRVHDVAAVHQAILLFDATGGFDGRAAQLPED